jgi:RNA polymerase sigma factor (TIGR02999 family)
MNPSIPSLIDAAEQGDRSAAETLFSTLYDELHRIARRELGRSGAPGSVSATTLLHEAYVEMADREAPLLADRARFMGYAARVMRGLIVDFARERRAQKRGGRFEITSLTTGMAEAHADDRELGRVAAALDELAETEAALAEVVDLKFFGGFSFGEIAAMKAVSERTVQRQWEKARVYLYRTLQTELD